MFGPALHLGVDALGVQGVVQVLAHLLDVGFALDAFFVEQLRHFFVGLGLQKTEGQVFDFPLDLPNAQAVGQWREDVQRLAGQRRAWFLAAERKVTQGLQARGQPQHDHAQVARKRQQHLAHVFGLLRVQRGAARRLAARLALQLHELGGLHRQVGLVVAESFGDHVVRAVEVLAGVDQIGRGLHGFGAAHVAQDLRHGLGVLPGVLTGVELLTRQERLGEGARTRQSGGVQRQVVRGGRGQGRRCGVAHRRKRGLHGVNTKSHTACT